MFSVTVRIDGDLFEMLNVKDEHFLIVMAQLDTWYEQRKIPAAPIHGTLVFGTPTEQPQP